MPNVPDLSGVALDGRYELHAVIGEGNFGRVYRGRDRRLRRRVAVKVIKPWWAEDPRWARRFEREAQLLASISDPGIVQVFDVGFAREGLYYVAELVDGGNLARRLRDGRLAPEEARDIAEQLARALARAHEQGIVHRDVKPANVLIATDGRIKVGDFGVAHFIERSRDAATATVVGTPRYMAPEQARAGVTSAATDVYGMGIVLYEMLAGRPPFQGESAVELALRHVNDPPPPLPRAVPRPLGLIVERALAKDPAHRYPDGRAMALALADARESDAPPARDQDDAEAAGAVAAGSVTTLAPPARAGASTLIRPSPSPAPVNLDATTGVLSASDEDERSGSPGPAPTRVADPVGPRRNYDPAERRQRIALLAVVSVILLGMIAGAIALIPGHVRVPHLAGMTRPGIIARAHRGNFRATFARRHSHAPIGTAIAQSPQPGARIDEGATVRVILSSGPPPVVVPRVVGGSAGQATATLERLKLRSAISHVPAPGTAAGTVTRQSPAPGADLSPGSVVALSVAESPRLRGLTSLGSGGSGSSVPFRIRGTRWQILYDMSYDGTCTLVVICSGPSATVTNLATGKVVDQFDLDEGTGKSRIVTSGPGIYQIDISPGSDTTRWQMTVDDYY